MYKNIITNFLFFISFFLFLWIKVIYWLNFDVDFWNESQWIPLKLDNLILNTSNNPDIWIFQYNKESSEYNIENKRLKIIQNSNSNTWFLVSEQYWDFFIDNDEEIILTKKDNIYNCSWTWLLEYEFEWKVSSEYWWDLNIVTNESYFCPITMDYKIIFNSENIWKIYFEWNWINKFEVIDSRWNIVVVDESELFKDKKIDVDWIVSTDDISSWYDEELWINNTNKLDFWWDMLSLDINFKKNLNDYTSLLETDSWNNLNWFSKKIHFYDYDWLEENYFSHLDNKWKILRLWDSDWDSWNWANFYKMQVTDHKLLYVKWWNIYIDSDIYNASDISQLVIVATRDSTNNKNGWNIYIDPEVTNIDAILIADWSILSYDWNKVISSIWGEYSYYDKDLLKKQLLIYWSIKSKNTLWKNESVYWTDHFIKYWWIVETWLYDLWNLRDFWLISSREIVSWDCSWESNKISVRNTTWTWILKYSFAWKKECYIDWVTLEWLKWTPKTSGVVIEYNTMLQSNPHFIFK